MNTDTSANTNANCDYGWDRHAPPKEENRVPFLIFLGVVLLLVAVRSMIIDDQYARARAIRTWPQVNVSSRDLIDECGVFMWVRWVGPGFGTEEPYIPMRARFR